MGVRRTKHAVYDLKYHLVWIPKYRKHVLSDEVSEHLKGVFQRIAEEYGFRIDTMEVMEDHVHVFVEVPPWYSMPQWTETITSAPLVRADRPVGEWNTFYIKMTGERVTVYLNGVLVTDNVVMENYWERNKPIYPVGQIELQAHNTPLYFKNIYIRDIGDVSIHRR
jgi:REP element-mobilizing transposase RayT